MRWCFSTGVRGDEVDVLVNEGAMGGSRGRRCTAARGWRALVLWWLAVAGGGADGVAVGVLGPSASGRYARTGRVKEEASGKSRGGWGCGWI